MTQISFSWSFLVTYVYTTRVSSTFVPGTKHIRLCKCPWNKQGDRKVSAAAPLWLPDAWFRRQNCLNLYALTFSRELDVILPKST